MVLIQHLDSLLQYLVFTRADGTWAAPLDPGDYNLEYHVLTPGHYELPTAGQSTFTLGAGQNLTLNGTAESVATSRTLQGRAVDTAGNPLRGVILSARQERVREALCQTDEGGYFTLQLDPGVWTLQASGLSLSSLGLMALKSGAAPSYNLQDGNQTGVNAVLAVPITSMITGTVTTADKRNLSGLSLTLENSIYEAEFQVGANGNFVFTSVAGAAEVYLSEDDCARLGVILPEESPILTFPASGQTSVGTTSLETGTLRITGRFIDLQGQPVEGMTVVAKGWGQTSDNQVLEARTRGGGYFSGWVKANQNYTLSQYGPKERTPTHIFSPIPLPSRGPGTNALGDVVCFPLDEMLEVTPVHGADGSALSGDLLQRALRPSLWVTVDFQEDRGVLWGLRELIKNGAADALRLNDTNTLAQIAEVCRSQHIRDFFSSNSSANTFTVTLPGNVSASLSRSNWFNQYEQWGWTNETINLPIALQMSIPSHDGVYRLPATRLLQGHPAVENAGLLHGFSYDGDQAVRNGVLGQWQSWSDNSTNTQINYSIRQVGANTIRVQYLSANGTPIPFRWLGYGIYEYGDPNAWGYRGVEYSGGAETDANGYVNLPAYQSWNDWMVTDWGKSPQPEGGIRVVAATNQLVLRQYSTKTISGLGATTVAPGGTLRVNGSNLDQAGASWQGRVKLVPASENMNSPGQGIDLPILSRSQSFMNVGIPGYLPNGQYRIRMDNSPAYLYSPSFTVSGGRTVNVSKLGSERLSFSSAHLVAGYGIWNPQLVLSNVATTSLVQMNNVNATDASTVLAEKYEWQNEIPAGTYGVWLRVQGLKTNWETFDVGPFGTLNWP